MNYTENVHDINLLPGENVGSAAFPLFPRFHGGAASPSSENGQYCKGTDSFCFSKRNPRISLFVEDAESTLCIFPFPSGVQRDLHRDPSHF